MNDGLLEKYSQIDDQPNRQINRIIFCENFIGPSSIVRINQVVEKKHQILQQKLTEPEALTKNL